MRLTFSAVVLAGLLLAGCAGHSVDCETGGSTKDCAPGTEGHARLVQQQRDNETVEGIDDARCRAFARPNSQAYLACRRRAEDDRKRFGPR